MTTAAITPLPPSFNASQVNLAPDGATVLIASLKLAAGNWIVYGKYQVVNENFVIATTMCRLTSYLNIGQGSAAPTASSGNPIDYNELQITAVVDQPTYLNVSLMGPCVIGAGGGYASITGRPLSLPGPGCDRDSTGRGQDRQLRFVIRTKCRSPQAAVRTTPRPASLSQ